VSAPQNEWTLDQSILDEGVRLLARILPMDGGVDAVLTVAMPFEITLAADDEPSPRDAESGTSSTPNMVNAPLEYQPRVKACVCLLAERAF
jgi:hypothetical protein